MSKKKTHKKSLPEKAYPKCMYCQTELTKGKDSKEHVVNRSILPQYNNKLTLIKKVCKPCNEGFGDIDTAFVKDTITGLNKSVMDMVNDEDRWDNAQEPFVIKNVSTTIRGDKQVFTVEANAANEKNMLRGIAKIALNALIYDLRGEKFQTYTDKQESATTYVPKTTIFLTGTKKNCQTLKNLSKKVENSQYR